MSLRPPQILAPASKDSAVDVLQHEIMQEKAATLGRLVVGFEKALAALQAFETEQDVASGISGGHESRALRRAALLDETGEALWLLVVQRETCGLRNTEALLREYKVPPAVRLRMGVARRT